MILSVLKNKLFKDTILYSIVNILDKIIPFLIMPIISRVLTEEDMGYYALFQVTFSILIPILTLSVDFSININYFKMDKEQYVHYSSTGFYLTLLIYSLLFIVSIPFTSQLSTLLGLTPRSLYVVYVIVILQFIVQIRLNLWQAQAKPLHFGLFAIPFTLVKFTIALILILRFNYGWIGILIGYLISELFFSLIAITTLVKSRYLAIIFKLEYVKNILHLSVPISIHKISVWLSASINRIIVNSLLGTAATGSFGIGSTFGTIVTVLEDAVNKAYWPFLYKKLSVYDERISKQLVKLVYAYYSLFIVVGLVIGVIGYYAVGFIFGDLYMNTRSFILPVVISSIINGLYKIHVNFLFFAGKTQIIARNTIICAIVNIVASYFFIKFMGLMGAAYSAILVQFVMYILTFYHSNKLYKLPWTVSIL